MRSAGQELVRRPFIAHSSDIVSVRSGSDRSRRGKNIRHDDIGDAFLNASMKPTGIKVHMQLDPAMAAMLVKIAPEYAPFLEPSGSMVVELDKALYGCVEASLVQRPPEKTRGSGACGEPL
jgi:hypothetical protein